MRFEREVTGMGKMQGKRKSQLFASSIAIHIQKFGIYGTPRKSRCIHLRFWRGSNTGWEHSNDM
jgi:hypothetical protein